MAGIRDMARHEFPRIQAGDIGFDAGVGLSGLLIRLGTQSPYGHCWVYHDILERREDGTEVWDTVEAGPRHGTIHRVRTVAPLKAVRVWQDEFERRDLLQASEALVGTRYGWGEIARILAHLLKIKMRRWRDNPCRVICSNHVAQAICAAVPSFGLYMRYNNNEVWPGELAVTCDAFSWDTEIA
jgi:hypothetical protein